MRIGSKCYYPIYKAWLGPIAFVVIHHPDDVEVREEFKINFTDINRRMI